METGHSIPETPYWKCSNCGHTLQAKTPPDVCESCHKECEFKDVTNYTPEGGFRGVDPRL